MGFISKIISFFISERVMKEGKKIIERENKVSDEQRKELSSSYEKYEKAVEEFCKKHPNHPDCRDKANSSFKLQQYRYTGGK